MRFKCVDKGFTQNEPVDVVVRPEDVDIVPESEGMLKGEVTSVTFKGVHYEIIVDINGFKWMIQTTDKSEVGDRKGFRGGGRVMKRSPTLTKLINAPYILWSVIFVIAPLIMVIYYAFTDRTGAFTLDNVKGIGDYLSTFILSVGYGAVATLICLLI